MSTSRAVSRNQLAFLLVVALLGVASEGCNVIQYRQTRIVDDVGEAGLVAVSRPIADATLNYWDGGEGPAVLLLHGFGADAMWQWYTQVDALAAHHRVIVPDLLWFGGSSSTVADYSLAHQVRVVTALLDELGIGRVHVVGISYGGLVGWELARTAPARVDKLVLVDSPGPVYTAADYDALCARLGVEHLGDVLVPDSTDDVGVVIGEAYYDPEWTPDWARQQVLDAFYAEYRDEKVAMLDAALSEIGRAETTPPLRGDRVLLVWGRHDRIFPLPVGERLAAHLDSRLEVIEEARHAPNLEHPDEFDRLLLGFLGGDTPDPG